MENPNVRLCSIFVYPRKRRYCVGGRNFVDAPRDFEETGRYRLTMYFRKSAGTVRSRRCQSAKQGVGAGATNKLNRGFLPEQKSPIFRICIYRWPQLATMVTVLKEQEVPALSRGSHETTVRGNRTDETLTNSMCFASW